MWHPIPDGFREALLYLRKYSQPYQYIYVIGDRVYAYDYIPSCIARYTLPHSMLTDFHFVNLIYPKGGNIKFYRMLNNKNLRLDSYKVEKRSIIFRFKSNRGIKFDIPLRIMIDSADPKPSSVIEKVDPLLDKSPRYNERTLFSKRDILQDYYKIVKKKDTFDCDLRFGFTLNESSTVFRVEFYDYDDCIGWVEDTVPCIKNFNFKPSSSIHPLYHAKDILVSKCKFSTIESFDDNEKITYNYIIVDNGRCEIILNCFVEYK